MDFISKDLHLPCGCILKIVYRVNVGNCYLIPIGCQNCSEYINHNCHVWYKPTLNSPLCISSLGFNNGYVCDYPFTAAGQMSLF